MLPVPHHLALHHFLECILPPVRDLHRNSANEASYVYTTLERIFLQHFGIRLLSDDIRRHLLASGYDYFTRSVRWLPREGCFVRPRKLRACIRPDDPRLDLPPEGELLHWGMDGATLRLLRFITIPCPDNTSVERRAAYTEMTERVKEVMKTCPHIRVTDD